MKKTILLICAFFGGVYHLTSAADQSSQLPITNSVQKISPLEIIQNFIRNLFNFFFSQVSKPLQPINLSTDLKLSLDFQELRNLAVNGFSDAKESSTVSSYVTTLLKTINNIQKDYNLDPRFLLSYVIESAPADLIQSLKIISSKDQIKQLGISETDLNYFLNNGFFENFAPNDVAELGLPSLKEGSTKTLRAIVESINTKPSLEKVRLVASLIDATSQEGKAIRAVNNLINQRIITNDKSLASIQVSFDENGSLTVKIDNVSYTNFDDNYMFSEYSVEMPDSTLQVIRTDKGEIELLFKNGDLIKTTVTKHQKEPFGSGEDIANVEETIDTTKNISQLSINELKTVNTELQDAIKSFDTSALNKVTSTKEALPENRLLADIRAGTVLKKVEQDISSKIKSKQIRTESSTTFGDLNDLGSMIDQVVARTRSTQGTTPISSGNDTAPGSTDDEWGDKPDTSETIDTTPETGFAEGR